jgi:hypothetical protein
MHAFKPFYVKQNQNVNNSFHIPSIKYNNVNYVSPPNFMTINSTNQQSDYLFWLRKNQSNPQIKKFLHNTGYHSLLIQKRPEFQ